MSKNAAQQHKKSVKKFPFEKVQVKMYSVNNPLKMANRRRRQKEKKCDPISISHYINCTSIKPQNIHM